MMVSIEHQPPTASVKDAGGRWFQTCTQGLKITKKKYLLYICKSLGFQVFSNKYNRGAVSHPFLVYRLLGALKISHTIYLQRVGHRIPRIVVCPYQLHTINWSLALLYDADHTMMII